MTTPTGPRHFDPRNIFLGTKWNVFMLVVGLLVLLLSVDRFADAYRVAGWWPDAGWAIGIAAVVHSMWISAARLWRARKTP